MLCTRFGPIQGSDFCHLFAPELTPASPASFLQPTFLALEDSGGYSFKSAFQKQEILLCMFAVLVNPTCSGYLEYGLRAVPTLHSEKPLCWSWHELLHAGAQVPRTQRCFKVNDVWASQCGVDSVDESYIILAPKTPVANDSPSQRDQLLRPQLFEPTATAVIDVGLTLWRLRINRAEYPPLPPEASQRVAKLCSEILQVEQDAAGLKIIEN